MQGKHHSQLHHSTRQIGWVRGGGGKTYDAGDVGRNEE
eukprot:CAMPEP_0179844798 /NCGR_PEP_ID=MMETSP0982-20121206/4556_1 /TAXON_ID=483367 /ORGANISM="non described non described, Strain CCMP 2436" /LENGTH=37 /DNA_ID= /DNA_START= /DNA_END= /DNA_ORIENTATION=